ncbi:MAG: site-2 protease family protein [Desulfatiglandales bacterium]
MFSERRFSLFKLLGFEVRIDMSWIVLAVLVAWSLSTGLFPFYVKNLSTPAYWLMGIIGAVGLFLSIILHEFAHSLVARKQGIPMRGITLFIFGGAAEMDEEPPSAKAEFLMAVVGPVSSLVLAFMFYVLQRATASIGLSQAVSGVLGYLAIINVILAVFNMVPAFPLDGGRILRSLLWKIKGNLKWATRVSSRIGSAFGIILIGFGMVNLLTGGVITGLWYCLIGFFLHSAAKMSYRQLLVRRALQGEKIERFMKRNVMTITPSVSIEEFVDKYVYRYHHKLFPVVADTNRLIGCVTTKQVKDIPREEWQQKRVEDIAESCSPENSITPETDAVEALKRMKHSRNSRLMVIREGRLEGILVLKDLLEFLSLKADLEEE